MQEPTASIPQKNIRVVVDGQTSAAISNLAARTGMHPNQITRLLLAFSLSKLEELTAWLNGQS